MHVFWFVAGWLRHFSMTYVAPRLINVEQKHICALHHHHHHHPLIVLFRYCFWIRPPSSISIALFKAMADEEFDEVHFGAHEAGIHDRLRPRRIVPMQGTCNTPYPSSEVVTQLGMEIHWSADDPDDSYVFDTEIEDCNGHHVSIHPIHASIHPCMKPSMHPFNPSPVGSSFAASRAYAASSDGTRNGP